MATMQVEMIELSILSSLNFIDKLITFFSKEKKTVAN